MRSVWNNLERESRQPIFRFPKCTGENKPRPRTPEKWLQCAKNSRSGRRSSQHGPALEKTACQLQLRRIFPTDVTRRHPNANFISIIHYFMNPEHSCDEMAKLKHLLREGPMSELEAHQAHLAENYPEDIDHSDWRMSFGLGKKATKSDVIRAQAHHDFQIAFFLAQYTHIDDATHEKLIEFRNKKSWLNEMLQHVPYFWDGDKPGSISMDNGV